ncbi:hypothetical protein ACVWZL_008699 [Bradyrhizobium sp. GM2.4]
MRKQLLRRHARVCLLVATAVLASPAAVIAESADTIAVNVDQAKLVRLPGKVATIVVGNPLIADVTLQPGGMIVVTGKGYGATNFIALDRGGEILVDRQVQVEGPSDRLVTRLSRDRTRVLQLRAALPAPRDARRQRHLLQQHDEPGRFVEQLGERQCRCGRQDELTKAN